RGPCGSPSVEASTTVHSAAAMCETWTRTRQEAILVCRETLFRVANDWTICGRSVFHQKRTVALQPWDREVHEGANSGYGKPPVRRQEVHRPWWRLVAREHDFELSPPHVFCDVIRQHACHATPSQDRSQHRAHAVAHQAWRKLNCSQGRRTGWRKR